MNKTKIDWADYTWNPVTGCYHGCEYCYARKIVERFGSKEFGLSMENKNHVLTSPRNVIRGYSGSYPWGFNSTFHNYKRNEPQKLKKHSNIFVCSMADLFGFWVPEIWIEEVFKACEKAPQHRYLFLTKNPERYKELAKKEILPAGDNYWFGTTVTAEGDLFFNSVKYNTFISIEPILSKMNTIGDQNRHSVCDWIIVGAETGNRKGKIIPESEWILNIKEQCNNEDIPIFMKESLRELMGLNFTQEFPW